MPKRLWCAVLAGAVLFSVRCDDPKPKRGPVISPAGEAMIQDLRRLPTDQLIEQLAGGLAQQRVTAARELGNRGSRKAVRPLSAALGDDRDEVRLAAAKALGRIGDPRAVVPLVGALSDRHFDIRAGAAWALGRIGHPLAVEPLLGAAQDPHPSVRMEAGKAMSRLGGASVDRLAKVLTARDWKLRLRAVQALGGTRSVRAVEPLLTALADERSEVRMAAGEAIRKIGGTDTTKLLVRRLKNPNWRVREGAAVALGLLRDPAAIGPLENTVTDPQGEVRWAAAGSLCKFGRKAIDPLAARLAGADPAERLKAAVILGYLRDKRCTKPLIGALGDSDASVRKSAAEALGRSAEYIAAKPLVPLLADGNPSVRTAAGEALREIGPDAIEDLVPALKNTSTLIRSGACGVLGVIGSRRPVLSLIGLLEDPEPSVRAAAAEALGTIGDKRAFEALLRALPDEQRVVRDAVHKALGKLGGKP